MTRTLLGLSLVLGLAAAASTASAQVAGTPVSTTAAVAAPAAAPRTDGRVTTATADTDSEIRQRDEENRIAAATRAGTIDAREAAHLARAMAGLQAYQERAYADGVLTLREQARLSRLHTRIDRTITRAIAR